MPDFDPALRARESYELAYARTCHAREEWRGAGQPLVQARPSGLQTVHPLLKALQSCEAETARRLEAARIKHRGPAPTAVVQADIGLSPAQKLRAVPPA